MTRSGNVILMVANCEKFMSLFRPGQFLKPGVTLEQLEGMALAQSDNGTKPGRSCFSSWTTEAEIGPEIFC